jgi:outer membrane protein
MYRWLKPISLLCVSLLLVPAAAAQNVGNPGPSTQANPRGTLEEPGSFFSRITGNYRAREVAPIRLGNSSRLDSLLRAGNLYLSLQDAIALTLENNLDIEIQRYGPQIADASVQRAQAGGFARGISTGVTRGAQSAAGGNGAQTGIQGNAAAQVNENANTGGAFITQTGTTIPNLDPVLSGRLSWGHFTTPQSSAFVTGTNFFIQDQNQSALQLSQGFLTGTSFNLALSNNTVENNNRRGDFNPSTSGTLGLTINQRLLQGFGPAVNGRQIRIARNNREVSDLVFKQQVIVTVASVINLYWDLVSFHEDVRVRKQSLTLAEKLYEDNRKQVEIGTLAPIEIVRAEAEVAQRQQDLTLSETQVLQQETILKNQLSRTGVASPALSESRIIPTDRIRLPDVEAIAPIQDSIATALSARPEMAQRRMQVENSRISLRGSKSALLPSVDAFVTLENNALAGQVNQLPVADPLQVRSGNPFFIGGYGTVLSQLLRRNFPDYSAGFQLNIPIRNRQAQADMVTDQLNLRQQELQLQQLENTVRVDVQNALIGLQQARARYQAASKTRILQEQTLDAEQKKLALGASTPYIVIQSQRDLALAQSSEVGALSQYARAKTEFDRATGQTLTSNEISIEEAFRGQVSRGPTPLPVINGSGK